MRKIIIPVILVGLALFIGAFVYFVSGVSATIPPIKKYSSNENVVQLITAVKDFVAKKAGMKFYLTDTTGNKKDGYAFYSTLKINDSLEYNLKFENISEEDNKPKTNISLVFAYNNTTNKGGYSDQAQGINSILNNFDRFFISPLFAEKHIKFSMVK